MKNINQYQAFKKALKAKSTEEFNQYIQEVNLQLPVNEQGDYALINAFKNNKDNLIPVLFSLGASINVVDENGLTPIMYLTQKQNYHSSNVKDYLSKVNDINQRDKEGNTALMHAAKNKDLRMIKLLNSFNALVNLQNNQGNSAVMLVYQLPTKENQLRVLTQLIKMNASPHLINKENENLPLLAMKHNAFHHLDIIECSASSLDFTLHDSDNKCAFHYALEYEDLPLMKKTYHKNINLEFIKEVLPFIEEPRIQDYLKVILEQNHFNDLIKEIPCINTKIKI